MWKSAGYTELFGGPGHREEMSAERDDALPANFESDCRLVHNRRTKTFVLCVPATRPDTQGPCRREHGRVISIDPGVRTFATCYDPTGRRILELGKDGPKEAFGLATRTTTRKTKAHRREWGVGAAITFLWRKARRIDARAAAPACRAGERKHIRQIVHR